METYTQFVDWIKFEPPKRIWPCQSVIQRRLPPTLHEAQPDLCSYPDKCPNGHLAGK
jgi:hypothetical protein